MADDSGAPTDDQILAQVDAIRREVAEQQALVGGRREPVDSLLAEYEGAPRFQAKVRQAAAKYAALRRVRGDGNCFYRAYLYGCLAWYAAAPEGPARAAFREAVDASVAPLLALGMSEFVLEPFQEMLADTLKWIDASEPRPSADQVAERFSDRETSDYSVAFARMVVSGHMQRNAALFEAYLPPGQSLKQFVASEVEPMGKDAEQLQCVALATELRVPLRIEYLDQSEGPLNAHDMPDGGAPGGAEPPVVLLYRPGHYDVLYSK